MGQSATDVATGLICALAAALAWLAFTGTVAQALLGYQRAWPMALVGAPLAGLGGLALGAWASRRHGARLTLCIALAIAATAALALLA